MAITYASSTINFVNSLSGSAANKSIKSLVPIVHDRIYHKQVQDKIFWRSRGLIGDDAFSEGGVTQTLAGFPVIRKTELNRTPGDHIVMGQLRNLVIDVFNKTGVGGGVTGSTQLVDKERDWDFYHKKVQIECHRDAVRTDKLMNAQRNPYKSLEEIEVELLSDGWAQMIDKSIFFALHWGQSPHFFRQLSTEAAVDPYDLVATPSAEVKARLNPNFLVGHDTTMTTYATSALAQTQMNTSDTDFATWRANNKLSPTTFEIMSAYARKNNWDLVNVDGRQYIVAIISPQAELQLRTNSDFRQSARDALLRGMDNWIFKKADYVFADCLIYVHNAINDIVGANRADVLSGDAVGGDSNIIELDVTEFVDDASATVAGKICQIPFFGANAIALAESDMRMKSRIEDDYGKILGRGVEHIYNCTRMDWFSEALTGPTAVVANQSSGEIVVGI